MLFLGRTADFYDRFSFLYPLVDIFLRRQKRYLYREINALPSGDLLDIGVGNGRDLRFYRSHLVTGIDTSPAMLRSAERRKREGIKLLQMDGQHLSFPAASFDYVVLCHVISVVKDPERLLEEAHRVLRPDGRIFILNHFTPDNWMAYVDKSFQHISKWLHFKSAFYCSAIACQPVHLHILSNGENDDQRSGD